MKQKIISIFIFIIIFFLFWIIFWKEFLDFQNNKLKTKEEKEEITRLANSFELSKIKTLEQTDLFFAPDEKLLEDFIDKIKNSKKRVYIEVYMFTEKRILEELKKAKSRWIDIKIILEKSPYMTENINNKHFQELKKANIDVKWSNTKNYYLNHSKFFIIDDLAIISTWNLTYSTFTINRDFFVFSKDEEIVNTLKNIFLVDFEWKKQDFYQENIILSPNYSRIKLEKLLKSATKNIKIYIQYLKDKEINSLLISLKKEKNLDIEIIIDKSNYNDEQINILKKYNIKIKEFDWKKMHAKAILVDEKYLFIWSINFSEFSIDKNRELWIILVNEEIIKNFNKLFIGDFNL